MKEKIKGLKTPILPNGLSYSSHYNSPEGHAQTAIDLMLLVAIADKKHFNRMLKRADRNLKQTNS